ncbi:charged multivesicular body 1a [Brachionus plicatilis]|uniref:Charged multivesicular body 1a n=1 Tax=Brachionus plicatilis TaxID=10195 RepID=A0A3M7RL37_BRAPC|nr:charged multivesicular body 1a [Brachionus plicatilis]
MGLDDTLIQLRMSVKQLDKMAQKAQKQQQMEKARVKKAIENKDLETAKIYAENSIRKKNEYLNCLRLSSRVDAVSSKVKSAMAMQGVAKNIGSVTKALETAMSSLDLEKVQKIMEQFEKQFENLDVKSGVLENTMSSATTLSTPQADVDSLIKQVAEEHGLEVQSQVSDAPGTANLGSIGAKSDRTQEEEDSLTKQLFILFRNTMSTSLINKTRLIVPKLWQQSVRYRGKYNVRMPKPRHDIARYLEEITKPLIVKELPDPIETCIQSKLNIKKKLKFGPDSAGEFEIFLAKFAFETLEKSEVMLICHKLDISGEIVRRNKVEFKKFGTNMWNFNTVVMQLMMKNNPKYKNLEPIVSTGLGRNVYFFFKEEVLKENLKMMKKMPHFVLLGGMINHQLYTRSGIQRYSELGDLENVRGQLVGTLNTALSQIPNTLSTPISNLSQALSQHSKPEE